MQNYYIKNSRSNKEKLAVIVSDLLKNDIDFNYRTTSKYYIVSAYNIECFIASFGLEFEVE